MTIERSIEFLRANGYSMTSYKCDRDERGRCLYKLRDNATRLSDQFTGEQIKRIAREKRRLNDCHSHLLEMMETGGIVAG